MARIVVLPSAPACPLGASFESLPGVSLCDNLLTHGVRLRHDCEKSCACTTCRVLILAGAAGLEPPLAAERNLIERAWTPSPEARLSCQTMVGDTDLVVEIPLA
jgi:ferredoxin, 2Fe-2S